MAPKSTAPTRVAERTPEYARAERLRAEHEDLQRRIRERDDRVAEIARQLKSEQVRAQQNAELYGAEAALRERAEKERQLADDARAVALDEAATEKARLAAAAEQHRQTQEALTASQEALSASQHALGLTTAKLEHAEAACRDLTVVRQQLEEDREVLRRDLGRLDPLLAVTEAEARVERLNGEKTAEALRAVQAEHDKVRTESRREIEAQRLEIARLTPLLAAAEAEARSEKESSRTLRTQMERECKRLLEESTAAKERLEAVTRERDQLLTVHAAVRGSCTILQERCALAEARGEKEAASTAKAWCEVEAVRSELQAARERLLELEDERHHQSEHLARLEAVLRLLEDDKAMHERVRSELLGLSSGLSSRLSSRREMQLEEALAAIQRVRTPTPAASGPAAATPSLPAADADALPTGEAMSLTSLLLGAGWMPPSLRAASTSPRGSPPHAARNSLPRPTGSVSRDLLTSIRLGHSPHEAVLRYVEGGRSP